MDKKKPADKASNEAAKPEAPKKDKPSVDPAQRKPGGFDRSILKGKAPIFRTMKKSGR
jgi:hypothetical protein